MSTALPKYLIVHLRERECAPNQLRKEPLPPISIQILDSLGRVCERVGYISQDDAELSIDDELIPHEVIETAKRLPPGESLYLDQDANPVEPF